MHFKIIERYHTFNHLFIIEILKSIFCKRCFFYSEYVKCIIGYSDPLVLIKYSNENSMDISFICPKQSMKAKFIRDVTASFIAGHDLKCSYKWLFHYRFSPVIYFT